MNTLDTPPGVEVMQPPALEEIGVSRDWTLPLDDDSDGKVVQFTGQFIGTGTSKRAVHNGHRLGEHATQGIPCSACRWFETRLFALENDTTFVIYNAGASIVPGEVTYYRATVVYGAIELIETLATVRTGRQGSTVGAGQTRHLNYPTRMALAQAADRNAAVRAALADRVGRL